MPESLAAALLDVRSMILDRDRLVRAVGAGRRRGEHPTYRKVELRWVDLRDGPRLQVVTYDDRQSFTRNVVPADGEAAVSELLDQPYGNWHVESVDATLQLRVTKKGAAQTHRSAAPAAAYRPDRALDRELDRELGRAPGRAPDRAHDRSKVRMLEPADPLLRAVGISDSHGRIKPTRTAKYRQVEEFLRALEPVLPRAQAAAGDDPLRVVDLGCGNAYLSFAGYRWLTEVRDVRVGLTGVDVKAQARERNTALAGELGWAGDIRFVEGSIAGATVEEPPHVVFALHACDTATDEALARAVEWGAPVVLAAPCCHHDVQRQLRVAGTAPAPYSLVMRHGILRERWADVLTDTVRAAILRLLGYRVEVIEFVDSAHTPRNTLLRAVHTGGDPGAGQVREYLQLIEDWNIEPALASMLRDRLDPVLRAAKGSAN